MGRRKRVDDDLKKDLTGAELKELLHKAHLPEDYPTLTPKVQRAARLSVLRSWFDPALPHVLCTDVENFVAAHFLYSEFYIKPAEINRGVYFFQDPVNKYELDRLIMAPPTKPEEPSKSVVTATRRFGKTQTIIIEMIPLMCLVRPFTCCLVSEVNDKRTGEELDKIKYQIERNERIHSDFGAEGVLFPKSRTEGTWNKHHLRFIHFPGVEIMGHSLGSAQRGRGPLYGVIDDPENEDNTYNRDWRRNFFNKLLHVYVPMFHFGGKLCWIGTPVHEGSCLSLAMRGMSEQEQDEDPTVDRRFMDWHRGKFPLIVRDEAGDYVSMQPERLSVQGFLTKMEIDPIAAQKEILCEPVTPGTRAFRYDPVKHGFMHCKTGDEEYMLDLYTGEQRPWKDFLDELIVFGAGDLADGQSADCDPGALVWIGIDSQGVVFVLDAWQGRVFAEKQVKAAYDISVLLNCEVFGWEKASLLCVVNRILPAREVQERRDRGEIPPVFREIENHHKNKVRRILTMTGIFGSHQIRFLQFGTIQGPDGVVHRPVDHGRESAYRDLIGQIVEFTDEGIRGRDDLIDALEMVFRLVSGRRGELVQEQNDDPSDLMVEKWKKTGFFITPNSLPPDRWTEKMQREMEKEPVGPLVGVVPYV